MERYAHISKDFRTQTLDEHLRGTAELSAKFAAVAGMERLAKILSKQHDAGKNSHGWQCYLKKSSGFDTSIPDAECDKGSHSDAGAVYMLKNFPKPLNLLLAYVIAGHHAGLPDFYGSGHGKGLLERFFDDGERLKTELLDAAGEYANMPLPEWCTPYELTRFYKEYTKEYIHMWGRFLFSCLVDADWLDTERFMKPEDFAARREPMGLDELKRRFDVYIESKRRSAPDSRVNRIRNKILERCIEAGGIAPGFFSLTVPTGGGKTLSSLAFALVHALAHGKRRIIIAEPYTSIIEQIAKVLKYGTDDEEEIKQMKERGECLFGEENVLEHHSSVDPDKELYTNRLAAQNWDAPIVVTTNVQLFESLLAASPARCRKLHNIADSIIILDEAQKIPAEHLSAVLSSLKALVKHFGVTVLLCTATQPALNGEIGGGSAIVEGIEECTEIIPDTAGLYDSLKRVEYRVYKDDITKKASWEEIAGELSKKSQVLCIVNKRKDCRELAKLMPKGTIQLSGFMCGEEISELISEIKRRLKLGDDVRVISTQLIEAGVDVDFPSVWRALAQLDSIAQAAGRSNREGRLEKGEIVIFNPESEPFGEIKIGAQVTTTFVSRPGFFAELSPKSFYRYFRKFYGDMHSLDKSRYTELLVKEAAEGRIQFREFAEGFKLVDTSGQKTVFVPYGENGKLGPELIERLRAEGPSRELMASLQRFTVNIPERLLNEIYAKGGIEDVHGYYVLNKIFYKPGEGIITDSLYNYDKDNFIY
ncbi:CRISPR-associated endonuclease Cas3'' [Cloacibacillus sp. An23]|uniref:CRISPR-associated endonuclease Cas3'' n=1 Tax=Cloacibacillus sp. An23 TaxID=1965591 RepID=UPI000B371A54|nr:CRISPR-associated endonuclease Cas3'' [Cloacibacillus sp. An23]OUO94101.1 CRISPR-associated endonuclease Cas3'' [Cloacibacillus sp. An23]